MSEKRKSKPSLWLAILFGVSVCVLLADGMYLLVRHIDLQRGEAEYGAGVCAIAGGGCDEVLTSDYSEILGISSGALGTAYGVVALLLMVAVVAQWGPRQSLGSCFVLLMGLGLAGSLAFLKILYLDLGMNCPLCVLYHAMNLSMTLSGWGIVSAWVPLSGKKPVVAAEDEPSSWSLIPGLGLPILAGLFIIVGYLTWHARFELETLKQQVNILLTPEEREFLTFDRSPVVSIPDDPLSPSLGNPDAPHVIVTFKDFECPPCGRATQTLKRIYDQFPDRLRIVFRHYPLGKDCNSKVDSDMHPQSCIAAEAAEAARIQGKFWEFHDLMYERQGDLESKPFKVWAQELGMDPDRLAQDMNSIAVRERIQADVRLGNDIGVTATPTIYMDGHELTFWYNDELLMKFLAHKLSEEGEPVIMRLPSPRVEEATRTTVPPPPTEVTEPAS